MQAACTPGVWDHGRYKAVEYDTREEDNEDSNEGVTLHKQTDSSSVTNCIHDSRRGLPLEAVINGINKGTYMYKLRYGDRFYFRHFYVDTEDLRLFYRPSRKICGRRDQYIDIREIEEVRKGWNTDIFNSLAAKLRKRLQATLHRHLCSVLCENNCFSVVTGPSYQTWDFVTPNEATRNAWVRGLNHLIATNRNVRRQQEYDRWLIEQVKNADVNNNGSLNFRECLTLLKQLNIAMDRKHARVLFDKANFHKKKIDGEDALDAEEFVVFYYSLLSRPEVENIMKRYSVGNSLMLESEGLYNFLTKDQRMENITLDDCEAIIEKFEPDHESLNGYMTVRGFREMLLSKDFDIFNHDHCVVYQDMTHPLSDYYIASSHNTYLVSGQLIGDSSVEGYIQALLKGCRCVEMDVWDGPDDDPIVFHGHTLTSKILFSDVLGAIKKYAFKISQYPVILSLENHCNITQQKKMAEHLIKIFGDLLYTQPVKKDEKQLPSPESLEKKIIVKGKKLEEAHNESTLHYILEEEELAEKQLKKNGVTTDGVIDDGSMMSSPKKELAKELSDIVNYCKAVRFQSFQTVKDSWKFYEMCSFEETRSLSLTQNMERDYIKYNKNHLSRIYPKGLRTDSSNYNPVPHWNVGCQIVALNYQTYDLPMILYTAKFLQNGRCGYVLKPEFLRKKKGGTSAPARNTPTKFMELKVISGQHIPKPHQALEGEVVDPYVNIKVYGHEKDQQKFKTKHLHDNGFNPVWNETFVLKITAPELALIVFTVKDKNWAGKNLRLAHYALPFTSVAEGYRHIHLLDEFGQPIVPASLFVHVKITSESSVNYRK